VTEKLREGMDATMMRVIRGEYAGRGVVRQKTGKLRQEIHELRREPGEMARDSLSRMIGHIRPQQGKERCIGHAAIGLEAAPLKDKHPLRRGTCPRLGNEARLADARLTGEEDCPPLPATCGAEICIKGGELGGAPDDDR
jgi:hypothetical protein